MTRRSVAEPAPRSLFLHDWVAHHAAADPTRPAIASARVHLTYGELADRAFQMAARLGAHGVGPGDRVLVALPNTAASVVATIALSRLGAVAFMVNRTWSPDVLTAVVQRSRAREAFIWGADMGPWEARSSAASLDLVWIVTPGAGPAAGDAPSADGRRVSVGEDGALAEDLPAVALPSPSLDPDQPSLVLYTSGSTGSPLGVVQTHRNIAANTRSIVDYLALTARDRALLTLPLHYCYGRSVLQTHLYAGGSVFLQDGFVFPRLVLDRLAAEQCTGFAGVPLTFELFRREVDPASCSVPGLRYLTQAGGAMRDETIAWTRQAFAPAQLYVMYGQTEATARLTYLPPDRAADKAGSIGIPVPGVELRVVDEAGRERGVGEVGELVAMGDNVTPGYLDDPGATAAILRDGWLWTGDLAFRDADGFLFHQGRAKEVIKVAGHRVGPGDIETVLLAHPGVREAAVCGRPDRIKGEVPVAFVTAVTGARLDPGDLRRHCQERLAPFMVPVETIVLDALPRNEAGKVMRAQLRSWALDPGSRAIG